MCIDGIENVVSAALSHPVALAVKSPKSNRYHEFWDSSLLTGHNFVVEAKCKCPISLLPVQGIEPRVAAH